MYINGAVDLAQFPQSRNTLTDHPERIRQYLRFHKCDALQRLRLLNYLTAKVERMPRSTLLDNSACDWLRKENIVKPAESTMQQIVATASETAFSPRVIAGGRVNWGAPF